MDSVFEVNFDGLVGPTHNYAGLSRGNIASMEHRGTISNPRAAALQGLAKMKALADLGVKQAVLPPHARPCLDVLRVCGFSGADATVLQAAARDAPALLAACMSASNMWVANAATVTPGSDTADGRVHLTPANLVTKFHRSIEPPQTTRTLRAIFRDEGRFAIHAPLPGSAAMGDEGAANHTRLAPTHAQGGLHLFVYGHHGLGKTDERLPRKFPSRQAFEASQAVVRAHGLGEASVVFAQQNPEAIDAGVFHNDVIAVGNENLLLYHEDAFEQTPRVIDELRERYARLNDGAELFAIEVPGRRVSLADAVKSYLFNSQIVTLGPGRMVLIAPAECQRMAAVRGLVDELLAGERIPIRNVRYFDLNESMRNGGGPACLRLRVVLTASELRRLPAGIFIDDTSYARLTAWVRKHYRERLAASDFADPALLDESRRALDELTTLLGLGSIYPFQTESGVRAD